MSTASQLTLFRGMSLRSCPWSPAGTASSASHGLLVGRCRIFGKMGHSERRSPHTAQNIPGNKHQPIFQAGVRWFG